MRGVWLALTILVAGAQAQTPLGTVDLADAEVQTTVGVSPVANGRAKLAGSSTVTAKEGRNADVTLARGGDVLVCQTSVLHATPTSDSLILALDRGAMEIRMKTTASDVVMTPDMRLSVAAGAELDLRMRVTRNGDTCIENRGRKAPALSITDAFGETSYQLKPGQHVMFEHGSLREVVDRETTPCGCPPLEKQGVSIAEAVVSGKKLTPQQQAAAAQPFPAAVSEGLAAPSPVPPEPADGRPHVQVATTLTFDPNAPPPTPPAVASAPALPQPAPAQTARGGLFRAIGHFFKRIFAR